MSTLSRNDHWSIHRRNALHRTDGRPVSMITRRHVKPECRDAFEEALRSIVTFAVSFPGHLDVHVLCQDRGHSFDCAIAHRFADSLAREAFTKSREYRSWLVQLQTLTVEAAERTETVSADRESLSADESRPSGSRIQAVTGVAVTLGLFLGMLWLPPAMYLKLSDWHPLARNVLSVVLLATVFAWLSMVAFGIGCPAGRSPAPNQRRTTISTLAALR